MTRTIIAVPALARRASVGAANAEARTVDVTFTSGADVTRVDWETGRRYVERLSVEPHHVRLDRLNAGAPLLNAHSADRLADQIGVVQPGSARIVDRQGIATVRFSKRADVEPIFQDVRDRIIRNVSVGYRVHQFTEQGEAGGKSGIPVRLATDWEPYEISMVPMGADSGARVRGDTHVQRNACVIVRTAAAMGAVDDDRARRLRLAARPREIEMFDNESRFMQGASAWLLTRAGVPTKDNEGPGEFRGMSLIDLARECLRRSGVKTDGLDKMALVARAFTHRAAGTDDFATVLENTMHKALQAAYAVTPDTWRRFCAVGRVADFRAHSRYRMGSFGALDSLTENGEYRHKAIGDAEKASITAGTKGNIIAITRQAIVNDDLDALVALPAQLGRAAARSVEADVYALLALNAGLGPSQSDGQPLFHSNRSNVGTGAALSAAAIDADAAVMARQRDAGGNDYLDLQPAVLLVPRELKGTALTINDAQYDPDTADKLQKPNAVRGLFRDVVGTPRLAAGSTRRYLFADPAVAPVFEVAFLEGQEAPVIETKERWSTDGAEMRVRFDYGVGAVDYRGAVTNSGTT